jgi:transcriptional regulator with XRE-family HTH domain
MEQTPVELSSIARQSPRMKRMIQSALLAAEMHPDRVGERVTAMRNCIGMSKATFADAIGLDRSSMSKVEAGTKGLDIVVASRIAEIYGFGLDYIYRGVMTDAPEEYRLRILTEIHAARAARLYGQ